MGCSSCAKRQFILDNRFTRNNNNNNNNSSSRDSNAKKSHKRASKGEKKWTYPTVTTINNSRDSGNRGRASVVSNANNIYKVVNKNHNVPRIMTLNDVISARNKPKTQSEPRVSRHIQSRSPPVFSNRVVNPNKLLSKTYLPHTSRLAKSGCSYC